MKDVPPYTIAGSVPLRYEGVNIVGLRRRGFTDEQINSIKKAYDTIYKSGLNVSDGIKEIKESHDLTKEIQNIITFIESSERGIVRG